MSKCKQWAFQVGDHILVRIRNCVLQQTYILGIFLLWEQSNWFGTDIVCRHQSFSYFSRYEVFKYCRNENYRSALSVFVWRITFMCSWQLTYFSYVPFSKKANVSIKLSCISNFQKCLNLVYASWKCVKTIIISITQVPKVIVIAVIRSRQIFLAFKR